MQEIQYISIANALRERIRNGYYSPGNSLESQNELAKIFNTTVMTVRRALSILADEGLITIVHGVGTFVSSNSIKGRDLKLRGFSDEMERYKLKIETRIVKKEYDIKDESIQRALGLGEEKFCRISRLRVLNDIPIIFQRSCIPSRYLQVVQDLADDDSLYLSLNNHIGGGVVEGREIIKPVKLGDEEAKLLNEKKGALALISLRISFNISQVPVLYDEAYLRNGYVLCAIKELGSRNSFNYNIPASYISDPISVLLNQKFWEKS